MEDTFIRGFMAGDTLEMTELHKKFSSLFEESELTVDYINQCSLRHDFRFYVAEHNGSIVGYSGVLFYESVGRAEIGPIAMLDEYQNKGVGSKLLNTVLEFLKQRSIHRVTAKVKSGNESGIMFFEKNGFKKEAVFERYTKKQETIVQMVRFI
ncbi:MAG: GNAT family N-acetyltransferase [Candidatus Altiarchaeales archaeon]|nr:GNAT family N-acetyltransferase [Candidatus Altiarchaeales archaeon]